MWRSLALWLGVVGAVWGQASYTLPFRPLEAEYSAGLQRIVMTAASPNQLHIYDPATRLNVAVPLPALPLDLAVSPSGQFAAVGHSGSISYVNLFSGLVERSIVIAGEAQGLVFSERHLHVQVSETNQMSAQSFSLTTFALAQRLPGPIPLKDAQYLDSALSPRGDSIFSGTLANSADFLRKLPLSLAGIFMDPPFIPYAASGSVGRSWLSRYGDTIYNSSGTIYWTSSQQKWALQYKGAFRNVINIASLTEFATRKELALIGLRKSDAMESFGDNEVRLYSAETYALAGRINLGGILSGGTLRPNRGRWVFNDGGSALYVIVQADPAAGLSQDFSLRVFDLEGTAPCAPTVGSATASAGSTGGIFTVELTGGAECLYRIQSSTDWIVGMGDQLRVGQRNVRFIIRPNAGAARSGTLAVGGQLISISQAAASPAPNPLPLSFNVVDAAQSKSLDRLVLLGADPPELHILNPQTGLDQVVPLRQYGQSVSVDAAGLFAAVGHEGLVTIVDLASGTVARAYQVVSDIQDLVWGENGYLYFVRPSSPNGLASLRLGDGEWSLDAYLPTLGGRILKQPGASLLYGGSRRFDISNGAVTPDTPSFQSNVNCSSNIWFYDNGSRLVDNCGGTYRTPPTLSEGVTYSGQVEAISGTLSDVSHSSTRRTLALLRPRVYSFNTPIEDEVRLYGDDQYQFAQSGRLALRSGLRGRFVFWNKDATSLFVIGTTGGSAIEDLPAEVLSITAASGAASCPSSFASPSGAVDASEGAGAATVNSAGSCAWAATSSAPWLRIQSGGFGIGNFAVRFTVEANRLAAPRVATIALNGGAIYTVTQSAAELAVEPISVTVPATGGNRAFAVSTSSPSTAWTAVSSVPWIAITGGGTGTGAGTVQYVVAANTGAARGGLIRVNSVNVSVLQDSPPPAPVGNRTPSFVGTSLLSDGRREFIFRDPDGANDLGVVNVLINRALDGRAACYLAYNASTEQFFLVDDAGTGLLALVLTGPTNVVTNSQCSVWAGGFSATKTGDTLTMRVNIQLLIPRFSGDLAIYAAARDLTLANSGWQIAAVSRPAQSTTPLNATLVEPADPTVAVGRNTFLRVDYESTFGIAQSDFTTAQILINNGLDGANACYLGFDRAANHLYLLSDDGTQLLLPGIPLGRDFTSSPIVVSNRQCEISSFGSSVRANGPNSLQLIVNFVFRQSFAGTKLVYGGLQATAGRNSGWKMLQALKVE